MLPCRKPRRAPFIYLGRARPSGGLLFCNQPLLTLEPPSISAELSALSYDAVTRNEDGDAIVSDCGGDRTNCSRGADCICDLGVRARLTERDLLQLPPDFPLERRGLDVQRDFSGDAGPLNRSHYCFDPCAERARRIGDATASRGGILTLKCIFEHLTIVAQGDCTDSALGCADEELSERCRHDDVFDLSARPAALVSGRRHAEVARGVFVGPAAGAVARAERSATDCLSALELVLHSFALQRADVLSRRESQPLLELSLQMIRTHSCDFSQPLVGDFFFARVRDVTVDVCTCAGNRGARRFRPIGAASLTRTKAGAFRRLDRGEKCDVIALWLAGRT